MEWSFWERKWFTQASHLSSRTHPSACDVKVKVFYAQFCPTLCNPMNYSLPGSSVHGIFQARTLEWVAISFPRDLPNAGTEPWSPALQADSFPFELPGKPNMLVIGRPRSATLATWLQSPHLTTVGGGLSLSIPFPDLFCGRSSLWKDLFCDPHPPSLLLAPSFWKIPPSALLKYCLPALGTQRLKYQPLPSCLIYISKDLFRIWLGFKINLRACLWFIFLPSSVVSTLAAH